MVVNSPYYRNDTIKRTFKRFNPEETIGLKANEYALMLKYISERNRAEMARDSILQGLKLHIFRRLRWGIWSISVKG
jgi:hypothetical protein